jgi:hypothetical protein
MEWLDNQSIENEKIRILEMDLLSPVPVTEAHYRTSLMPSSLICNMTWAIPDTVNHPIPIAIENAPELSIPIDKA